MEESSASLVSPVIKTMTFNKSGNALVLCIKSVLSTLWKNKICTVYHQNRPTLILSSHKIQTALPVQTQPSHKICLLLSNKLWHTKRFVIQA